MEGAGEGALEGPGSEAVVGEGVEGAGDGIAVYDGEGEGITGWGRGQLWWQLELIRPCFRSSISSEKVAKNMDLRTG
ncbi:hypothetical protein L1987_43091 [Smallanthus sonchifolius]|uniref:Uncharacterized protein n=1 Tax=Smallanthus sonchifolius TaxID=185202 RepID=A0ACB9GLP2_9ASTR|nr:hypothetical protein L1987_43091 [Smallanthus sonchifolius]